MPSPAKILGHLKEYRRQKQREREQRIAVQTGITGGGAVGGWGQAPGSSASPHYWVDSNGLVHPLGQQGASNVVYTISEQDALLGMIRSRMRSHDLGFDHVHCVRKEKADVVLVLVVIGEKHELLEDGYALFPSDTLITQLRLLAK